jgi:hypothetical protein
VIFSGASAVGWRTDLPGLVRYHVCAPMPAISRTGNRTSGGKGTTHERSHRWCSVRNGRLRHGLPDSGCTARSGHMMFLAGWLLHSIPLAAALGLALMATQRQRLYMITKPLCCSWYAAPSSKIAQRRASTRSTTRRLCRPLGRRFRNRRLYAEPKVRIRLPPAASPSLSPSCFRGSRTPAFRAAVRGGLATGSAETRRVVQDRANRRQYLCRAIFQYRSAADGVGANATPVPIKSGRSPNLDRALDLCARTALNQSPARSADRARQAADVSARGASPASDRAAAAH